MGLLLATTGCLARKVIHATLPGGPAPALNATLPELVSKIDAWSGGIKTLIATVDLEPTAGSVYSGVVKEYHDVKAFVLLQAPSEIRILGLAPVVRTTIFDMVSNGEDFRLSIPPQQKFIVGKNTVERPAKNALENLRPQHILQALLVPAIEVGHEKVYREKLDREPDGKRYYVVGVVASDGDGQVVLLRKEWFDRASLDLVRSQFYDTEGDCTEDVHYSGYHDYQGIHFPAKIELERPLDDYTLAITIEKATFNTPIVPQKFVLEKPEGEQLIDLNAARPEEHQVAQ